MDYAAAGIFLNITGESEGGSAPWWELAGSQMAPGLEAMTPVRPLSQTQFQDHIMQCTSHERQRNHLRGEYWPVSVGRVAGVKKPIDSPGHGSLHVSCGHELHI